MIKITNLNKFYNKGKNNQIHVINDTNLVLPEKGLISFLGTSGSGKTTLLNVIGGLDKANGVIEYDGMVVKNYNVGKIDKYRKSNIGYIFQNYNLLPNETVYNNLAISLEMIGIYDKEEIDKRIEYTLKAVGMFKYRKKMAYALSGGQQQRVSIARALVKNAKVIIADEPTGNLDSENTIEVMNILKKISKTTLVLLVTHDINVANFYSDKIIRIKDGSVIEQFDNNTSTTLSHNNTNNIYLKDMELNETSTDYGSIKLYHNEGDNISVDIDIIVRNGNIYLRSDKPIKLVETSNLNVINDHYKELKKETMEDADYDTSWFENKKSSFKDIFSTIIKMFKNSFQSFIKTTKKGKLLNFSFVLMGMILALGAICVINFVTTDASSFIYADGYYQLTTEDHVFTKNPVDNIVKNFESGAFENITLYQPDAELSFKHRLTFQKEINLNINVMVGLFDTLIDREVVVGRTPISHNEIVVDYLTAKDIVRELGNRALIDEVLGKSVLLFYKDQSIRVKIVGVVTGKTQHSVFGNEEFYVNWSCPDDLGFFGSQRFYKYEVDGEGKPLYEIVDTNGNPITVQNDENGRDVKPFDPSGRNYEAIIPYNSDYITYKELEIGGYKHKVVGFYKYREGTYNVTREEYITNTAPKDKVTMYDSICVNPYEYLIIDGREPRNLYECMVSVYNTKFNVGDRITVNNRECEVVGKYNGTVRSLSARYIVTMESYIFNKYQFDEISFSLLTKEIQKESNEVVMSLYDVELRNDEENKESNEFIFKLLFFILVVVSAVFIFFVMRSKMISEIYDIGVYRSIGATRGRIIGKFIIDILIITTIYAFVGYLAIAVLYNISAESINYMLGEKFFINNNLYFVMGACALYLVNLIFGIIPALSLLRKTPAEICAKYDI